MQHRQGPALYRRLGRQLFVAAGAVLMTLAAFLILPLIQTLNQPPLGDVLLRAADVAEFQAPDDVEEPEPEKDQEEEPPPEADQDSMEIDLASLELAMNPGLAGGFGGGEISAGLSLGLAALASPDSFSGLASVDQPARPRFMVQPALDRIRKQGPGSATMIFTVTERGRVEKARVESSSDPAFNEPCLAAIKQWRFDPALRGGKPVSSFSRQKFQF